MGTVIPDTDLVRAGAATKPLGTFLRWTFHQHFEDFPQIFLITLQRQDVLQGYYLIKSSGFLLQRDIVRIFPCSQSPRSFRVIEHEGSIEAHLPE